MFWLWPENIPLWNAWHSLQSQWRSAGADGQRTGLDYAAVTAWLQAHGWHHRRTRSLRHALAALGAMEAAALRVWAERAQQQAAKNQRNRPPA